MLSHIVGNRRLILLHLTAVLVVLIAGTSLYVANPGALFRLPVRDASSVIKGTYIGTIGEGNHATANMLALGSALASGKTLVILGSSELAKDPFSRNIPYNFFPQVLHIPVFAYGHAYFQSFGIYGLLAANRNALSPQTKLVLLISPGWFNAKEMPLSAFVEHFKPQVMLPLYFDPDARHVISQYINSHFAQFKHPSLLMKAFIGNSGHLMEVVDSEEVLCSLFAKTLKRLFESLSSVHQPNLQSSSSLTSSEWKRLEEKGAQTEIAMMQHNPFWVRDDLYQTRWKNLPLGGRNYFGVHMDPDPELAMLERALCLLQSRKVHALVMMQTLNPLVFKDTFKLDIISHKVAALSQATGMSYYDVREDEQYKPGMLQDGQHVGELGWVKINRQIAEYWYRR